MNGKIKYKFHNEIWQHAGSGGWYFVSLPNNIAREIRENLKTEEQGWGRLKATAKIGASQWETAIWFDTKMDTYLLPIKAEIRKKETLKVNDAIETVIWI